MWDPHASAEVEAALIRVYSWLQGRYCVGCTVSRVNNNDDGKIPIAEVTALLFYCNGVLVVSTSTDCNGNFYFENLRPGTHPRIPSRELPVCVCDDREHCWYLFDKLLCKKDHFVECCKLVRGIDKRE